MNEGEARPFSLRPYRSSSSFFLLLLLIFPTTKKNPSCWNIANLTTATAGSVYSDWFCSASTRTTELNVFMSWLGYNYTYIFHFNFWYFLFVSPKNRISFIWVPTINNSSSGRTNSRSIYQIVIIHWWNKIIKKKRINISEFLWICAP